MRDYVSKAEEKGIVFNVGHGGLSGSFEQAIPALKQGFKPNAVSTDLHTGSMNGGMKDMINVMSKLMNMGMSLQEVISRSTWDPAVYIGRDEIGHLSKGAVADIEILNLKEGSDYEASL